METNPAIKNVVIVGAGFSGLTLAALLAETGKFKISIYDKKPPGGLISSSVISGTLFENAAPSLLNHHEFENFAIRLGVRLHPALRKARKRFLFLEKPERWPLGLGASLKFLFKAVRFGLLNKKSETLNGLSLEEWSVRYFGNDFTEKVLKTAMLGIYAAPICELSAELVAKRFFVEGRQKNRAKIKGSVVPEGGLSNFLAKLEGELLQKNVGFVDEHPSSEQLTELQKNSLIVFATGFSDFAALVSQCPEKFLSLKITAAAWLNLTSKVTTISLAKVHLLLPSAKHTIDGFGMLFHPNAGFQSLGVIANSQAFAAYGPAYNESWIIKCTDPHGVLLKVATDRQQLFGENETPASSQVSFNKNVYPLYDKNLQTWLGATHLKSGIYATGNYWGALGLTQIFLQNQQLCERICNNEKK